MRLVDLDGDGLADVLVPRTTVPWHPSLGEDGFGAAETGRLAARRGAGPARGASPTPPESIFLADMSGDGLADIVRIRNGEVCYWPNLGYGRFGPKVTMDDAPRFDHPDSSTRARVRLADIDGSGTTDVFYLGRDGVRFWRNQSGNSWSARAPAASVPATDDLTTVSVVDLLGNGTACLVWSSPLPARRAAAPLRYVDLMGGQKPHLLTRVDNNLGSRDPHQLRHVDPVLRRRPGRRAGRGSPGCRSRCTSSSGSRPTTGSAGNRFVTRYAYHHGFFDGVEREFRGFGMVEQWDTEELGDLRGRRGDDETPTRTCRRCSPAPGSTPAPTSARDGSAGSTRASTTASRA